VVTVRPPARKSARQRKATDAGALTGESGAGGRWAALMRDKPLAPDAFRRLPGAALTPEWLEADADAFREPVVIEAPDGLGMTMPGPEFTVQDVADAVGADTPVEVIGASPRPSAPAGTPEADPQTSPRRRTAPGGPSAAGRSTSRRPRPRATRSGT
jgi:hypothetical protein